MTVSLTLDSIVAPVEEQVSCELGGEVVILNLRNSEYFGLNPVAAWIWERLPGGARARDVRDAVLEEYPEVSEEECTRDLLELLAALLDAELVLVRDGADLEPLGETLGA